MKRIKTSAAAKILGVTGETVRAYAREGWIARLPTNPDPDARSVWYFDEAEVEAFAKGGAAGAKAYRETAGPKATVKRGRKVGAR